MKQKRKKSLKDVQGITLIALVITIIVLLILAAVSIATLTGENGILTKAQTAKKETDEATAIEKVKVAVMGSYDKSGNLDFGELKENLKKEGITVIEDNGSSLKVSVDGYTVIITENGEVNAVGELPPSTAISMEEAKTKSKFDTNTEIEDKYGNKLKIPEGFKIASDSADDVTGGVVIEDVSNSATVGSQFVWVPVGTIYTNVENTQSETIELSRYTFMENGTPLAQGDRTIGTNISELAMGSSGNGGSAIAKDIEAFKTSVTNNGGYYIGRYEARTATKRTNADNNLEQVTVKGSDYVYNYILQPQAAKLSREMYGEDRKFTSDLINSYAWDTAIVFIQTFEKSKYSRQESLNGRDFAEKGTNNLADETNQDEACNIWDMSSNMIELTTENSNLSAVFRAGQYIGSPTYTSDRQSYNMNLAGSEFSFRPILYL